MAYQVHFASHLVIGDVPMSTPAWEHLNLYVLLSGADTRGDNLIMPGAAGVRPLRKRPTQTNRTLDLAVFGDRRWDGYLYPDPVEGLYANIEHLRQMVVDPLATEYSVRTATLVRPGATAVAAVQVLGFEITESVSPWCVQASMDLTLIGGAFT